MNVNFEKWYQSGLMVDRKLGENPEIVKTIMGLPLYLENLKRELQEISRLNQILNKDSRAKTLIKNLCRTELTGFILDTSTKMIAAGHITNNVVLEKASKVTNSELHDFSDDKLMIRGRKILDLINEHLSVLKQYGVGQPESEHMARLLDKYSELTLECKYTRAEHRESYIKMKEVFAGFKSTMRSIDLIMETAQDNYPDFYRAVREVRRRI